MGLKGILSISGMPGLYKVLAQTKSGFIVESLSDKKRQPVSSTQRISMLEDISVYSTHDDIPLKDVLIKIKTYAQDNPVAEPKANPDKLRAFFKKVVPDYDEARVYPSDIKKMLSWFQLVKDVVDQEDEKDEDEPQPDATEEQPAEPTPTDKD